MAKEAGLYKLIFESRPAPNRPTREVIYLMCMSRRSASDAATKIAEEEGWKGLGVRHVWFDKYMESPRL